MNDINWWVTGPTILLALIPLAVLIREWRRDRFKPPLDVATTDHTIVDKQRIEAELDQMANESNAYRDRRLWSLEGFLNVEIPWRLLSITYGRTMRGIVEACRRAGHVHDDTVIPEEPPPPPPVPDPPVRASG